MFVTPEKIHHISIDKLIYNSQLPRQNLGVDRIVKIANSKLPEDLPLVSTTYTTDPNAESQIEILLSDILLKVRKIQGHNKVKVVFFHQLQTQELLFIFTTYKKHDLINPLEEAIVLHQLNKEGFTHKKIAQILNVSRSYITNKIRLLQQPKEIIEALINGEITEGHVKVLMGIKDKVTKLNLLAAIKTDGLSVKQTSKLVSTFKGLDTEKTRMTPGFRTELEAIAKKLKTAGIDIDIYVPMRRKGYVAKLTLYLKDALAIKDLKELLGI